MSSASSTIIAMRDQGRRRIRSIDAQSATKPSARPPSSSSRRCDATHATDSGKPANSAAGGRKASGMTSAARFSPSMNSITSTRPKRSRSLCVARRELSGRRAGVGKALVGTASMAPSATFKGTPAARAKAITWLA